MFPLRSIIEIVVVIGGSVGLTWLACKFMMRVMPLEGRAQNNDVSGFIYATLGVVYAVVMAFVIVIVWEQFTDAQRSVQMEANALMDVVRDAEPMPDHGGERIRDAAAQYIHTVIDREWPAMEDGRESDSSLVALKSLWSTVEGVHPQGEEQLTYFNEVVRHMNEVFDWRRIRILGSREKVPAMLWLLLIGGGVVTIGFSITFGARNHRLHVSHVLILAAVIAFELHIIRVIDSPYKHAVRVSAEPFELILDHLERRL